MWHGGEVEQQRVVVHACDDRRGARTEEPFELLREGPSKLIARLSNVFVGVEPPPSRARLETTLAPLLSPSARMIFGAFVEGREVGGLGGKMGRGLENRATVGVWLRALPGRACRAAVRA